MLHPMGQMQARATEQVSKNARHIPATLFNVSSWLLQVWEIKAKKDLRRRKLLFRRKLIM
jgi:hypothetical protein